MRVSRSLVLVAGLAGIAWSSCNPSDFNTILDRAPVVSVSTGGSSTGAALGVALPPPAVPGSTVAARLFMSRQDSSYVALADFDKDGKATVHQASSGQLDPLGGAAVVSAAARSDGSVLLGLPSWGGGAVPGGGIALLTYAAQADGSMAFQVQPGVRGGGGADTHLGIAVATGNISSPGTEDLVVVGDSTVQVVSGADPRVPIASSDPVTCSQLAMSRPNEPRAFRAVAVGDVSKAGLNSEIVVGGQTGGSGPGMVVFLVHDGTPVLKCPRAPMTLAAVPTFGASLAVEDFSGDGIMDLAVGVPPATVYVYFGPLDNVVTGTPPSVEISSPTSRAFGTRIAAYRAPSSGALPVAAKLLVSDPSAAVDDRMGAGRVYLFGVATPGAKLDPSLALASFFDSNTDESGGAFGSSLGGLLFNTGVCSGGAFAPVIVPWAASGANLLTFFNYPVNPTLILPPADPRCFATK